MPYAIITRDKPDSARLREEFQGAHKRYLDAHNDRLLLAGGAMLSDDGTTPHGGILILDTDDRAEAEAFIAGDPFHACGLFESIFITRWRKAFFHHQRFVDL